MPDLQLPHHHGEGQNTKFLKAQLSKPETFQTALNIKFLYPGLFRQKVFVEPELESSFLKTLSGKRNESLF